MATSVAAPWDPEGRRVPGGAIASDPPALEGDDALSFGDLLSIVNPLQHIPIVSTLYRWITGDTIKPAARVIGGALFGGPIGLAAAGFNAIIEQATGKDIGGQMLAMLRPDPPPEPQVAKTAPAIPALAVIPPRPGLGRPLSAYQASAGSLLAPVTPARVPVAPAKGAAPEGAAPSEPPEGPPSAWFTAAMLRGLDQYRAMQRPDPAPAHIDVSY